MAFGKCGGGGRRAAARKETPLFAVYTTVTYSHAANLIDVSRTGARLRGRTLPRKGEQVMLTIDQVRAFGIVKWARGIECGIHFDDPMAADDVDFLQAKVTSAAGYRPGYKEALDLWMAGEAR